MKAAVMKGAISKVSPKALLSMADERTRLVPILFAFWAVFWVFSGASAFISDSRTTINKQRSAAESVLMTGRKIRFRVQPVEPTGLFGMSRYRTTTRNFSRIGVPKAFSVPLLYFSALFELAIGLAFSGLLFWSVMPRSQRDKRNGMWGIFADRTVHRLAFKGAIFLFAIFAVGSMAFGNQEHLWQHGVFLLLTLVSYDMWSRTDRQGKKPAQQAAPQHHGDPRHGGS